MGLQVYFPTLPVQSQSSHSRSPFTGQKMDLCIVPGLGQNKTVRKLKRNIPTALILTALFITSLCPSAVVVLTVLRLAGSGGDACVHLCSKYTFVGTSY